MLSSLKHIKVHMNHKLEQMFLISEKKVRKVIYNIISQLHCVKQCRDKTYFHIMRKDVY